MAPTFYEQVALLISVLPQVAKQECFALKGGTAINLFVRDMPRLSVDIDLAYLPVEDRDTSLAAIDAALHRLTRDIEQSVRGCEVSHSLLGETDYRCKLLIRRDGATVKVEVTPVLRGSVLPAEEREVSQRVQDTFGYARMQVLSFEDLYAGKLCAALDRQHPRDLYDVHLLLDNEGITPTLKDVFMVYLLAHGRPMVELLDPNFRDLQEVYRTEFEGMVVEPIGLEKLVQARSRLTGTMRERLTDQDKRFLLDVKRGRADWSSFPYPGVARLPAIRWKLHNLDRMSDKKRQAATDKLEALLFGRGMDV